MKNVVFLTVINNFTEISVPKKPTISITIVKSSNHNVASSKQQQQQHRSRMSNPNPSFQQKQQRNEANNYHYFPIVVMSYDGRCGIYEYYKPAMGSDKCAAYINSHKTTFVRSDNTCTFWYQNFAYEAFEGYCDTSQGHAGFSSDCRNLVSWHSGEQNSWCCKSTWDNNKHGIGSSYSKTTAFTITFQNENEIPHGECLVKFLTNGGVVVNGMSSEWSVAQNIVRSIGYQGSNGECLLVADGAIGRCETYQQIINKYNANNGKMIIQDSWEKSRWPVSNSVFSNTQKLISSFFELEPEPKTNSAKFSLHQNCNQ